MLKLTDIQVGCEAVLIDFDVTPLHQRLLTMGISPGSIVTVERKLPLHGCIFLTIGNRSFALRVAEAEQILVNRL